MGFWPKAIVWIIIVIVGFMYIRSLAQREDVTATTDQAVATPEVQQSAVLEPVATEAAGTGETAQTDAILSGEKQLPAPEERAAMEQKTTEAAEQTTAEVQQLSAADTVVEETAPQPVAPTTVVTEETTEAAMAQTVDSVAEQPEAAAPEIEAEVPEQALAETSDTVAAEQSAEAMAQNEPAEATAATAVEESGTTEATASEPQQVTAEPAPITPPARPSFAERMQRERPQPPKRPTFEERFGRDAMARPQPSIRPSLEERFGQRPMTHPQPSEIPPPEAKDAEAAQTTDQPVEATTGPMQPPPRQAFADRMRRGWAPPPRRPSYPEFPGQGEAVPVPESDIYADPRQMGRPAFRPRNWGYGYGYPSAPYGGYQNYPRYYQGQEYPSARFPQ